MLVEQACKVRVDLKVFQPPVAVEAKEARTRIPVNGWVLTFESGSGWVI